jgi:hypothetical protein
MFDQLFESFRKASESSLQAQQEAFKQWVQQWPTAPLGAAGGSSSWVDIQKRWLESAAEALNMQRGLMDSTYKSGLKFIEQAFKVTEARTPEDYRSLVEELWHKLSEDFKTQSETQFRDLQDAMQKWFERNQHATAGKEAS